MRFKTPLLLAITVCLSVTAVWASTISKARITGRDQSGNGALRLTVDGKETVHIAKGVYKAWLIEDGGAVIYALDGGHAMDFHTHYLMRHDELGSGDGDMQLMGRLTEVKDMRVAHSGSGKPALVVMGMQDGTGSPTTAIVHPTRGVVWFGGPAKVTSIRGGMVTIAEYAPEAGGEPGDKPIRTRKLDLDSLLTRPVLKQLK